MIPVSWTRVQGTHCGSQADFLGKLDDYSCHSPNATTSERLPSTLLLTYRLTAGGRLAVRTLVLPFPQEVKDLSPSVHAHLLWYSF